MLKRRLDGADVRVRFGLDQTGIAVTRAAANALRALRRVLVQHDPQRHVEGLEAQLLEVIAELLDTRLVCHAGCG